MSAIAFENINSFFNDSVSSGMPGLSTRYNLLSDGDSFPDALFLHDDSHLDLCWSDGGRP